MKTKFTIEQFYQRHFSEMVSLAVCVRASPCGRGRK